MMDAVARPMLGDRHVQRLHDQVSQQVSLHGPAHDSATQASTTTDRYRKPDQVGMYDVSDPELVTIGREKLPCTRSGCRARVAIPPGCPPIPAAGDAHQAVQLHDPTYPLVIDQHSVITKFRVHSRLSVRLPSRRMDAAHRGQQDLVRATPSRWWTLMPRIIAARRQAESATHEPHRKLSLIRFHELESRPEIDPLSRANQARLFRISRSNLSCLFSRRRRCSSTRSSVVRQSLRTPWSNSVCWTQFLIACADGSDSSDTSPGFGRLGRTPPSAV